MVSLLMHIDVALIRFPSSDVGKEVTSRTSQTHVMAGESNIKSTGSRLTVTGGKPTNKKYHATTAGARSAAASVDNWFVEVNAFLCAADLPSMQKADFLFHSRHSHLRPWL